MIPTALRSLTLVALINAAALAQEWTGEQLEAASPGFQIDGLNARLTQVGKLLAERQNAFSALVARLHGDHREYRLKVDQLLDQLSDPRWQMREDAERSLIEIGGRANAVIVQRKDNYSVLEQNIRCTRILEALKDKGTEQEVRECNLLRGLVATTLYLDAEPRLLRSLRSAIGHTDSAIVDSSIRALGKLGGDDEADAVAQMVSWKGGFHRQTALGALGRMRSAKAIEHCRTLLHPPATGGLLEGGKLTRTEAMAIVRALQTRRGDATATALLGEIARDADPVLAAAAKTPAPSTGGVVKARFAMPDKEHKNVEGVFGGVFGETVVAKNVFDGLPAAELAFAECDAIDFPDHQVVAPTAARIFLNQGSLLVGKVVAVDPEGVRIETPRFGLLTLRRSEIQGIALDPALDRMVGASTEHDRVRLRTNEFVDGKLASVHGGKVVIELLAGGTKELDTANVAGILFTRPRVTEPDATIYTRADLVTGERLIGFLAAGSEDHLSMSVPLAGAAVLPLTDVARLELGVGGGAMWGFTLIADYSDNKVVEVDDQGRIVFEINEIFGAWDAECLDNGNLLITEFSISRVQEIDRKGKMVWAFEDLKNPYDADRLPNGNTLIADTFGSRVIEVSPDKKIVWSYGKDIRPFDCDRLPNGNTLIADVLKDRVIEVDPAGEIVWEVKNLPNAHDADRLPNGNTLVTLRNKGVVVEIDREGKTVWELTGLSSPSDADRLPNGHTIVAENTRVREFDRRGTEVWKKEMTWAVEVNRY